MTGPADPSGPPDPLDGLVADYLQRAEAGAPPDRDALLAAHPESADRLRAFFADLDRLASRGEPFRLPDLSLPEDFGDYEILGELGRGGMGVVYRARQKSLGRVVALKMVLGGWLVDPVTVARFRDEAGTAARLDHPHIVPIHEVGEHRGHPFFSMKLIEGESLTKCLARYLTDPKAAAGVLAKVCHAVHHAHRRGVLHRDLKPGNIVVDAAGEPHVTDFGLARRVEEARGQTRSGVVVGTPEYMAPEQAAGGRDLTTAADVYGLGAVLYALLTGRPPFPGASVYTTLRAVIEDDPVAPRRLRREVPRDLEVVCLKCLDKEPGKRYASAEALGADLERWLKGEPVAARRVGRLTRLRMWARRRPAAAALVGVSAAAGAVFVAGAVALAAQAGRLEASLEDATTQRGLAEGRAERLQVLTDDLSDKTTRLTETVTALRRNEYSLEVATYAGKIAAARRELDAGDKARALATLDECQWDLRGWEFDHLAARCTTPDAVVTLRDRAEVPVSLAAAGESVLVWAGYDAARADRRGFIKTAADLWGLGTAGSSPFRGGVITGFGGEGHQGRPTSVAVTPDGRFACSGDADGVIKVWRPPVWVYRAELAAELPIRRDRVTALAFSPDGKRLFLVNWWSESLSIHEMPTGKVIRKVEAPGGRDRGPVVVSPDGERFLFAGCLWGAGDGKRLADYGPGFTACAFSPDGRLVAGLRPKPEPGPEPDGKGDPEKPGECGRPWAVLDAATGKEVLAPKGSAEWVAFGPSGAWLVTTRSNDSYGGKMELEFRFHDARSGAVLAEGKTRVPHTIEGHPEVSRSWVETEKNGGQQARLFLGRPESVQFAIRGVEVGPDGSQVVVTVGYEGTGTYYFPSKRAEDEYKDSVKERLEWRSRHHLRLPGPPAAAKRDEPLAPAYVRWSPLFSAECPVNWTVALPKAGYFRWAPPGWDHPAYLGAVSPAGDYLVAARPHWLRVEAKFRRYRDGRGELVDRFEAPDNNVCIYRTYPRDELAAIRAHAGAVNALALNRDATRLLSAGADGAVSVWNPLTGERLHTLDGHDGPVRCLALPSDGPLAASGGADGTVRVWNVETGQPVHTLDGRGGPVRCLTFLQGDKEVVAGTGSGSVCVWSVAEGKPVHTFPGRPGPWDVLTFSPRRLSEYLGGLSGHSGPVTGVAAVMVPRTLPDGDRRVDEPRVVTGGQDGTVRVWNVAARSPESVRTGHAGPIRALCGAGHLGHSGAYTAGGDGEIRKWEPDFSSGRRVVTTNRNDRHKGRSLAFTPDGRHLVATDGGVATVWDVRTNEVVRTVGPETWRAESVALSPDGKLLAVAGYDENRGFLAVLDFATGEPVLAAEKVGVRASEPGGEMPDLAMKGVAFSPDGKYLLAGNTLLDPRTGRVVREFTVPHDGAGPQVRTFRWDHVYPFSADGRFVALGANPWADGDTGAAAVWDVATGELKARLKGVPGGFGCLAFSPKLDLVAVGNQDGGIAVYDAATGEKRAACPGHTGGRRNGVNALVFTADGRRIISGGEDGTLRVWDPFTGQELLTLRSAPAGSEADVDERYAVTALALSPDGTQLGAVVGGEEVKVWRIADAPRAAVPHRPGADRKLHVRFSPDARLAAVMVDGLRMETVDLTTGRPLQRFDHAEFLDGTTGKVQRMGGDYLRDCLFLPDSRAMLLQDGRVLDPVSGRLIRHNPRRTGGGDAFVTAFVPSGDASRPRPYRAALTAGGTRVVELGYGQPGPLQVCDLASGKVLSARRLPSEDSSRHHLIGVYPAGSRAVVYAPPRLLVCALPQEGDSPDPSPQGSRVRDIPAAVVLATLEGHTGGVRCGTVSPDGRLIATGGWDGTVRVWDGETGKALHVLKDAGPVSSLTFSPDGAWLAAGGDPSAEGGRGDVVVWKAATWERQRTFRCEVPRAEGTNPFPPGRVEPFNAAAVAFTPDGRHLRVISRSGWHEGGYRFHEWEVATGRPVRRVREGGPLP